MLKDVFDWFSTAEKPSLKRIGSGSNILTVEKSYAPFTSHGGFPYHLLLHAVLQENRLDLTEYSTGIGVYTPMSIFCCRRSNLCPISV